MDKKKIFLIFFSVILSSLFNLVHSATSGCSDKRGCYVSCRHNIGFASRDCNVTSCTFKKTKGGPIKITSCNGSCWKVLEYNYPNQICDFSCGTGCLFSCRNCQATGPNARDWHCDNCK
ncbi:hypothetical protein F8M41_024630 [Gigaspora margarita]|uniref:Uncharacterized protein n=1 Tax=Gigaspora margarita TaxID=4874 RepID=A0A8H4AAR5_GIGMA|nr:hypothetical protein F8M41_024630 [Gigaspora margarita]